MAQQPEYLKTTIVGPPFKLNEDDAQSNLGPGECPTLDYFYEHEARLWPVVPLSFGSIAAAANIVAAFPIPDLDPLDNTSVVFTDDSKMYSCTNAIPTVMTEITLAGGSTALSLTTSKPINLVVVGTTIYFSTFGDVLRKWVYGAATYSDVAAPGAGYHVGVKLKPYFLATHLSRLLIGGDAAAGVGASRNDFIWSVSGTPEDFSSFGSGRTTLNDTPDNINGLVVLYNKPIILKSANIVIATPTGDALAPYNYERYNHGAQLSIGCWAPRTLANDGFNAIFLSRFGMVQFDGSQHNFIGKGVDDHIMAAADFSFDALAQLQLCGAFGGIFVKKNSGLVVSGNHPTRTYIISSILSGGKTWLWNERTGGWFTMSAHQPASCGAMFFGTAVPALVISGGGLVNTPCLCLDTQIMPSAFQPQITIPTSAFQPSGNRKTITRVGVEFQVIGAVNHPAFTATPSVIMETSTIAGASQTLYPATNPSLTQPYFTWLDVIGDGYCPAVNIKYPAGDGVTTRYWPQISRFVIEYQIGDVR